MIFFDTETTGLKPGSICQLSYIKVSTEVKPHSYHGKNFYFTVEEIEAEAEKVHGMSVENLYELSNGMYFEDNFEEILEDFIEADILIGHNVNFDINFLTHEIEGCGEELIVKNTLCTMNYYRNICKLPGNSREYKRPKLEEAIKFLNITEENINSTSKKFFDYTDNKLNGCNYHDARYDTAAVFLLITEGIKKGFIPPNYISKLIK